jgi:xylulokinase
MRVLLGVDLGTSGLKAGVFGLDGTLLGLGRATNEYLAGPEGYAEQGPAMWWAGCCAAIRQALAVAQVQAADVVAVGVCGFHHCPVFLDAQGEPTRPTIVTHDRRLGYSLADLSRSGVLDQVVEISGSRVMTGHFPPIYHLVRTQDPDALEDTRWILLAKDYLRFRLTGEIGTELCDATGTNLIAMPEQTWSDLLCELLHVPRHKLPEIGQSSQVAGYVTHQAAQATGLKAGTPVVYGGGDSHCALVGLGVIGSGEAGLLLGTNSTLRASFAGMIRPQEQMVWIQQHVLPGRFTVSASSMAGSSVLAWFKDLCLGHTHDEAVAYSDLETMAASVPPGSDGLLFHPYLYGERSPFYNPEAGGAFLGIRYWHGRGHFVRSVMEGIAFVVANCVEAIEAIAGQREEEVTLLRTGQSGGGRLPVWRQILADVLGRSIEVVQAQEPGCLGAALLAGVGLGEYEDLQAALAHTVRVGSRISPDLQASALYKSQRMTFNETFGVLEPVLYPQHMENK